MNAFPDDNGRARSLLRGSRRPRCLLGITVFLVATSLAGDGPHAQQEVRLAVIVHPRVPASSLNAAELASLFIRATRTWKDGTPVRPLNLPPSSAERIEFDRVVLNMSPDRSAQYWIDRQVRGEEPAPKAITKAGIIAHLVPTLAGSIGYIPEDMVDAKVRVIARIRGGKVIAP